MVYEMNVFQNKFLKKSKKNCKKIWLFIYNTLILQSTNSINSFSKATNTQMDSFKALQQISEHLGKSKVKKIDIIGNDDSDSRFTELYTLLREGKFKNEDEAARHFYGEKANRKSDNYRKFKSQFKERLLNTFVFIDASIHTLSDRQSAGIVLHRDWAIATLLQGRGLGYAYVVIGERLIAEALKFDFYDIAIDVIAKVKGYYATQTGDKKKYFYYDDLFEECTRIVQLENRARRLFEKIRINYVKSARFQPEQAVQARIAYEELKPALEKYNTFNLHFLGRGIEAMQYSCVNNYSELLKVSESTIAFFRSKSFDCRPPLASALQTKLMCCIALKKHEEGKQAAVECLEISDEGTVNWFKTLELKTILYLHTGQYQKAFDIYDRVRKHKDKKYLQQTYQEMWLLIEAYLYFLIANGHIAPLSTTTADLGEFKISKFLNKMDLYGKDKEGLNIPTLIIKIILLLSEKRTDEIIDYLEALNKYRVRHVDPTAAAYRSHEFMKVLEQLPKTNFNATLFEAKTMEFIENIKAVPVNVFACTVYTKC